MGKKNPNVVAQAYFNLTKYAAKPGQAITEKLSLHQPSLEGADEVQTSFPLSNGDFIEVTVNQTVMSETNKGHTGSHRKSLTLKESNFPFIPSGSKSCNNNRS